MPGDHLGQVDTLLAEQVDGQPPRLRGARGMHGDRRAGPHVRTGHRAGDAVHPGSQPRRLDTALEERRLHPGGADVLDDVTSEIGDHRLRRVHQQPRAAVGVLVGQLLIRVQAGGHHDVQLHLFSDPWIRGI